MQKNILLILDGVGWGRRDERDAVWTAQTPFLDSLMAEHPWALLKAHGTAVGLPSDGDMGNSEVGHNAMGAGRIFSQGASLVNAAMEQGTIWRSAAWKQCITHTLKNDGTLHLMGLVSDGNVHSHIDHLCALITQAKTENIHRLCVHMLTDGRDVSPRSALDYLPQLERALDSANLEGKHYRVATGGGRMFMTMDRYEADWPMVQRGWNCHVHAEGRRFASAQEAISTLYTEDPEVNDQWLPAFVVDDYQGMSDGDSVIFFNFRGDRAIEISRAFTEANLTAFERGAIPDIVYAGMMEYDGDLKVPPSYLVPPPEITDTVGDRLAAAGIRALAISETQKFGHVTFFFNGNRSAQLPHETQREVPSANIPFNQKPEMSAEELCRETIDAIESGSFEHIRVNFANGDMVGHTGDFDATVAAIEFLDDCIRMVVDAAKRHGFVVLLTADHGNADEMAQLDKKKGTYKRDSDGRYIASTAHSINPVPIILIDAQHQWSLDAENGALAGGLAQIGGSLLHLSGLEVPKHYLPSLLQEPQ